MLTQSDVEDFEAVREAILRLARVAGAAKGVVITWEGLPEFLRKGPMVFQQAIDELKASLDDADKIRLSLQEIPERPREPHHAPQQTVRVIQVDQWRDLAVREGRARLDQGPGPVFLKVTPETEPPKGRVWWIRKDDIPDGFRAPGPGFQREIHGHIYHRFKENIDSSG